MPKWLRTLALPVVALALVASACGGDDSTGGGSGGETGATGGR